MSVEAALCNTFTFGYDTEATIIYLFNDEYPTATQTSNIIALQNTVDNYKAFPLNKFANEYPYRKRLLNATYNFCDQINNSKCFYFKFIKL